MRITELEPGGYLYVVRTEKVLVAGKVKTRQLMASLRLRRTDLGQTEKTQVEGAKARALDVIETLAEGGSLTDSTWPQKESAPEVLTIGVLVERFELRGLVGRCDEYREGTFSQLQWIVEQLGRDRAVASLSRSDMDALAAKLKERGIRQGTIAGYLDSLKRVCNWALDENDSSGRPLLDRNPLARVKITQELSPRRPWATPERYAALRMVVGQFPPEFGLMLDLAWCAGRRIGAILGLRWQDICWDETKDAPHGTIRWYAGLATDSKKTDQVVPMNAEARAALERYRAVRPGIGEAWVFQPPRKPRKYPNQPFAHHLADKWLADAEAAAKLQHEKGGGWHMFRRGWVTLRKHLPLKDVAAAGGWRDTATVLSCYQHPDPTTMLTVVNGG